MEGLSYCSGRLELLQWKACVCSRLPSPGGTLYDMLLRCTVLQKKNYCLAHATIAERGGMLEAAFTAAQGQIHNKNNNN